jgi:hypothetical protein
MPFNDEEMLAHSYVGEVTVVSRCRVVANTLNLVNNGVSLLANAFGVGFIG